ncbi:O-succinylbenzoic acid--CoA ligase [Flavivirga aquatica]|uniref:O-succinylbenzoic acid--CoA ligase n=1 Tax=Flavivirga aquatica TaxID=1849968 RepID=A0A1E5TBB1_9FLAO|nr:AMP-binding protein [Flavivirga aquatica]OEK08636.1 O-succinylbenzoic acid--CoA ligase [Flavivirga aquatica]
MILSYKKIHPRFKLNGFHYTFESLLKVANNFVEKGKPYEQVIGQFLSNWLDNNNFVIVYTSGSTGKPKPISIQKKAMVNSALATGHFFKLESGNSALHCLPSNFIAGKMMLVRALVLGLELDLVEPTSRPQLNSNKKYDFCAMIPLQMQNSLKNCNHIKAIIVGGASMSPELKKSIQYIESSIYETYGMTETVTHIAIKKINNNLLLEEGGQRQAFKSYFKTLPNVIISQDERECLVIEAPKLSEKEIITNDIVKLLSKTEFEWLGRYDNVINSGGIKIFPEQIEIKLQKNIKQRFFVTSIPHKEFGEQVILVLEGQNINISVILKNIKKDMILNKYEIPKQVYSVPQFIETSSGKIQRKKTLEQLNL